MRWLAFWPREMERRKPRMACEAYLAIVASRSIAAWVLACLAAGRDKHRVRRCNDFFLLMWPLVGVHDRA